MRIDGYAWSEPTGQLRVRVTDSDGELLPSRIYLTGSDGRAYFPHGSYPRVVSVTEDYYFHTDGSFSVTLPAGETTVEAWRGFEYEPVSRAAEIRAGEHVTVELQLDRWIDMAADGWYSGDNHIHPNYGGHYFVTPEDLRNKAHAEDLNVANGMIANYWGNSRVEDLEHFLGHPHPHTGPRTIVYYNEEYRPSYFAHLSLLNLTELITPFYIGSVGTAHHALYPDNASVLRRVHEQGGIGGYVHPLRAPAPGPRRGGGGIGAGAARGRDSRARRLRGRGVHLERRTRDGRGLVPPPQHGFAHPGDRRNRRHDRHLAASRDRDDAHLRLHRRGPRPLRRVGRRDGGGPRLRDQRADHDAGRMPGNAWARNWRCPHGDVVTVRATARSLFTMHGLEIVQDGRIVHRIEATGDLKSIDAELEIAVEGSGWIAARVLGPAQHGAMDSYLFAHTNPVFVIADGEPIRSLDDAAFFVRWIDQVLEELRAMDRWDDPAQKAEVLATFEEGRRLYQAQVDGLRGSGSGR